LLNKLNFLAIKKEISGRMTVNMSFITKEENNIFTASKANENKGKNSANFLFIENL